MNILILSDLIAYSGVGQYMIQLGNELRKHDQVSAVVLASPIIQRDDLPKGIVVEKLVGMNNIFVYIKALHSIIKQYNIDIVHCNHRKQVFIMRLYQILFGKIPVVWTCHTVPYPNNWLKRILGYYGHKSIAISSEAKEWMRNELKINESKIDVVLNGVDSRHLVIPKTPKNILKEEFFKKRFDISIEGENTKIIVAHGRLHPIKGLGVLVDAFSKLSVDMRKNIKVVMSGNTDTPYYDELKEQIMQHKLEQYFFFSGWSDSNEIFSIADLMVAPSLREGFPLAAVEAFLMKVPVIRTKVGGYIDMKDSCCGIAVNNADAITSEITEWIKNPSRFDNMIENAYNFAMNECTVKHMAKKTLGTYNKAIQCCQ